jgi:cell division protein FtsI (penicillin-binding protein 3)
LHGRLRWGLVAVCLLLLVIGGRLVQLQGLDHGSYADAATAQRLATVPLHALRGSIVDRDGTVLAYTSEAQDVTADPKMVPPAQRSFYAQRLSPILGVPATNIEQGLAKDSRYALLARALSPVDAKKVEDLGLKGIFLQATTERNYPGDTTAANVLGTVQWDGAGAAGIEQQFNRALAGKDGTESYTVDNVGNINPSSKTSTVAARNGSTLTLTLDQDLQFVVQQYLQQVVPASGARGAQAAVLDAKTGQVLALASNKTFDANDPNTIDENSAINPPVMTAFEPGSVQKAITFAAAIEEKKITPTSMITVQDSIRMGGVTVKDAWWHPTLPFTATGVLAQSSNVGTLKIAEKLGPAVWDRYENLFGVGQKTGIELPGESGGYLPPMDEWSESTFANLPFGQGQSMTVLQLASIYQTLANDGVRIPPRIVKSVTADDGTVTETAQPKAVRAVSPATAKTVRTMLESVVMAGGTGVKAAVPGYRVAGKTGTAQQPDPNTGKYSDSLYWVTFAGMIPADDPQVVIAVMVDQPHAGLEGGDVAAPLFNKIAAYEVQHAHIPPTGSLGKHVPLMDCKVQAVRMAAPRTVC